MARYNPGKSVSELYSVSVKVWFATSKVELVIWYEKSLALPAPCILESFSKMKIKLNFYFALLCGALKGFMKAFIKPFEAPQRNAKIRI